MRHPVKRKQHNSKMCTVCGLKNPYGLKTAFYEIEGNELVGLVTPAQFHQGYPGRLHGGIATALLDETVGRAIMIRHDDAIWGVTVEFTVRFRKPIPLDCQLRVVGRIVAETGRSFEGTGEILLPDGEIAASGSGKYLKLPIGKIANFDVGDQEWKVSPAENDPAAIDI